MTLVKKCQALFPRTKMNENITSKHFNQAALILRDIHNNLNLTGMSHIKSHNVVVKNENVGATPRAFVTG